MSRNLRRANPFYVVLLLVGVLFCLTASAYGLMTLRGDRLGRNHASVSQTNSLMQFMDRHGATCLTGELLVLGVLTAAAIATDDYWSRRDSRSSREAESR